MNKNTTICVLLVIFLCFPAFADKLSDSVIGNCGSEAASGNYILKYTMGEEVIGISNGTGYELQSGFWYIVSGTAPPDSIPPTVPVLAAPLTPWTTNQTVNFKWEESSDSGGISRYEFQVCLSSDIVLFESFMSYVTSGSITSTYTTYTSTSLNYGQYYWSVRAVDNNNNPSSWANPWSILISSRAWKLYMELESDELVADNEQGVYLYAKFVEPIGSTEPLTSCNYPVNFKVYCGQTIHKSSQIISENGIATYYYQDNIAGIMTIEAEYDNVAEVKTINNFVPMNKETVVWCAEDGGLTQVICPANTFSGNVWIDITHLQEITLPEGSAVKYLPNSGREITASMGGQLLGENDFNQDITLVISYNQEDGMVEGIEIDEDIFNIYRLKDGNPVQILGTIDPGNNKVRATLRYLSTYFIGWAQPTKPKLYPNFPNPFTLGEESTCIMYDLIEPSGVNVKIYNLSGELIKILKKNEAESNGQYKIYWDGKNEANRWIAQGIYVCVLETAKYQDTIKIAVLKKK